MNAQQVFVAALEKVRNPETWCQRVNARDKYGNEVNPLNPEAVKFCSVGALFRANETITSFYETNAAVKDALYRAAGKRLAAFNDNHTHAEVVAFWERVGRENGWLP